MAVATQSRGVELASRWKQINERRRALETELEAVKRDEQQAGRLLIAQLISDETPRLTIGDTTIYTQTTRYVSVPEERRARVIAWLRDRRLDQFITETTTTAFGEYIKEQTKAENPDIKAFVEDGSIAIATRTYVRQAKAGERGAPSLPEMPF